MIIPQICTDSQYYQIGYHSLVFISVVYHHVRIIDVWFPLKKNTPMIPEPKHFFVVWYCREACVGGYRVPGQTYLPIHAWRLPMIKTSASFILLQITY